LTQIEGAEGTLTMNNGRSFPFVIRNVRENQYVSYLTKLPGADADWYWEFKPANESATEIDLKMGVTITGPATFVWKLIFSPFLPAAFDKCTKNLKTLIEEGTVDGTPVEAGV
ncbi:hypothetical protein HDU76_006607, partial [Blyttiomyces sp. JEL0837]